MTEEGRINLDCMITHEIGLEEIPQALDLCSRHPDQVIKVVVYPGK